MTKFYFCIILSFLLFSCSSNTADTEKLILGDWEILPVNNRNIVSGELILPPPPPNNAGNLGYYFAKNGICENKVGYFDYVETDGVGERIFLGTETKYKIVDNTLQIFDLAENKWQVSQIQKMSKDSLILLDENNYMATFIKRIYKIDSESSFDKIVVSTSGCYGRCPVSDIIISKTGDVLFFGKRFTKHQGYLKAKIRSENFVKIERDFKKADYQNLENNYSLYAYDLMEISVTFIKDNKIVKSIIDYGGASPTELKWALYPLIYLEQKLKLEKVDFRTDFIDLESGVFKSSTDVLTISKSEGFYLNLELQNAKQSNIPFTANYILINSNTKDKKIIETDGRFFKIELSNSKLITLDLGYNFFERNNFSTISD